MGQRLVVEVKEKDELLCTLYFHWSGYTASTYDEVCQLVKILEGHDVNRTVVDFKDGKISLKELETEVKNYEDKILQIIHAYEELGGGLSGDADNLAYAKKKYPHEVFKVEVDRNNGLVDISPKGMQEALNWAEANAVVDISEKTVSIEAWMYILEEDFLEEQKEGWYEGVEIISPPDVDIEDFCFSEAEDICELVSDICGNNQIIFDGTAYMVPIQ